MDFSCVFRLQRKVPFFLSFCSFHSPLSLQCNPFPFFCVNKYIANCFVYNCTFGQDIYEMWNFQTQLFFRSQGFLFTYPSYIIPCTWAFFLPPVHGHFIFRSVWNRIESRFIYIICYRLFNWEHCFGNNQKHNGYDVHANQITNIDFEHHQRTKTKCMRKKNMNNPFAIATTFDDILAIPIHCHRKNFSTCQQ